MMMMLMMTMMMIIIMIWKWTWCSKLNEQLFNYSPQCWWLVVIIYRAAKAWGIYPLLVTSASVNNCYLFIYLFIIIILKQPQKILLKSNINNKVIFTSANSLGNNRSRGSKYIFTLHGLGRWIKQQWVLTVQWIE